jgi:hypothetical protein
MLNVWANAVGARYPLQVMLFAVLFIGGLVIAWPTTPVPNRTTGKPKLTPIEIEEKAKADEFSKAYCIKIKANKFLSVQSNAQGKTSNGPVPRGHWYDCADAL